MIRACSQMRVQAAKRAIQLQEWATQINGRIQSGQTIKAWCEEYGLSSKTYYYRLKRVREELLDAAEATNALTVQGLVANTSVCCSPKQPGKPVFAALPVSRSGGATVTVRMGNYSVEIQNGADSEMVGNVLQTISRL